MWRTVIKSRKHGLTKISFKTLNLIFPMGWDGTGGGGVRQPRPLVILTYIWLQLHVMILCIILLSGLDTENTCYMVAITSMSYGCRY